MKFRTTFLSFLFFFPVCIFSQDIYMTRTGHIDFVSDAPLEFIAASSDQMSGAIDVSKNTFAFTIPNKSFTGFNSPLQQEHFYENYMETDRYKNSVFRGKIIEPIDTTLSNEQRVRAKGVLSIHGVDQERIISSSLLFEGKFIIIKTVFVVPLVDHNIRIPKIVRQKIAENITVTVNARLERAKPK